MTTYHIKWVLSNIISQFIMLWIFVGGLENKKLKNHVRLKSKDYNFVRKNVVLMGFKMLYETVCTPTHYTG